MAAIARLADATRWLRQHGASERSFGSALNRFFHEQAQRIAEAAQDFAYLSPESVSSIFSPDAEHERLLPVVRRNLGALMAIGAENELKELDGKSSKSLDEDYMEQFGLSVGDLLQLHLEAIPFAIRQRILAAVDESAAQPYWRQIQDGVQADIGTIIKESLDAGDSGGTMARKIAEGLGESGRRRSKLIARTETTGALNAGHDAAISEIAQSGEPIKKQWLSIVDDRCRQSHQDADGQVVAPGANFAIGGFEAAYPGDYRLPVQERANCRCTTVGAFE